MSGVREKYAVSPARAATVTAAEFEKGFWMSVIVPAHNEERTMSRLLRSLLDGADPGEFEIVVVCNGCTDRTAAAAREAVPADTAGFTVIELGTASKAAAIRAGDGVATRFPRVYVDADVQLSRGSLRVLTRAVQGGSILAAAPRRVVETAGASRSVRWFYDVWSRLPQVQSGLFGRGVIVLSHEGWRRLSDLPSVIADDLVASEAFSVDERRVVDEAVVTVWPPRTLADLLRRRIRAVEGNRQADERGLRTGGSRTGLRTLLLLVGSEPRLAGKVLVFLAVASAARVGAQRRRQQGVTDWLRDESSRSTPRPTPTG